MGEDVAFWKVLSSCSVRDGLEDAGGGEAPGYGQGSSCLKSWTDLDQGSGLALSS